MKNIDKYNANAVFGALIKFYDIHDIAEAVSNAISEDCKVSVDVYRVKSDGFILRKKKDTGLLVNGVYKAIRTAIKKLVAEADGVTDYISDQYEVDYTEKMVDIDFIQYIFTVNIRGRIIFVEIDSLT